MPYLSNAWYVGALSSEVTDRPLARVLLDKACVLFRGADGLPAMLHDRCPHRFAPLSMGRVRGKDLECSYHGLRFGRDGKCTLNPHGNKAIPAKAQVKSYPTVERYGFVWFWPGDPSLADRKLLPSYPYLEDPDRFDAINGYLEIAGNYQLLIDNLLDLSHVEFLHPDFARQEGVEGHKFEFRQDGNSVIANRLKSNCSLSKFFQIFWESNSSVGDSRANIRWDAPAMLDFDLGVTEVGAPPEQGVCLPNVILLTPATEYRTHYFWGFARNAKRGDPALSERLRTSLNTIFKTEDGAMIERQQQNMGRTTDIMELHPVLLEPDMPAVRARRILKDLIAREQLLSYDTPSAAE